MKYENYQTNGFFDIRKVNFCYIKENINEMLFHSYNISKAEDSLKNKFNSIKSIQYVKQLSDNKYSYVEWDDIDNATGFFKFELYNLDQIYDICDHINDVYGWFPYVIIINGHIPFRRWNQDKTFTIQLKTSNGYTDVDILSYINSKLKGNVNSIELYVEAKYTVRELITNKDVYHITDRSFLDKIKHNGLVPKQKSGTPNRIYFTDNPSQILNILGDRYKTSVLLKLNLEEYGDEIKNNIKFYKDPRIHSGAFFTYSNIHPKYLQVVDDYNSDDMKITNLLDYEQ